MNIKSKIDRIIEFLKFDYNEYKFPLVLIADLCLSLLKLAGKRFYAIKIASGIFRTGWSGSFNLGLKTSKDIFSNKKYKQQVYNQFLSEIKEIERTEKFFRDPSKLLGTIILVLKSPGQNEKGALILNYNYYFPLFLKFFDVEKISEKYNIILEPSWAGFCDLSILSYTILKEKTYLMTYEKRDRDFIDHYSGNFIPINIGPNWFVNYKNFSTPSTQTNRDIDIIMVAGWAKFKRHESFFKCISKINKNGGPLLKICLVGYPTDMTKDEIIQLAKHYNILEQIQLHEWIHPEEVAELYRKSKINILWSKFEGNNRAIIEGMLCGTPVILRRGHNYGEKYDFINSKTGNFADEKTLDATIRQMLENLDSFKPREYILENRTCSIATDIMNSVMKENEISNGRVWTHNLAMKTNELHSMNYFDCDKNNFNKDYEFLASKIKSGKNNQDG